MKPPPAAHLLRDHARWLRIAWPLGVAATGLALTLGGLWWQHPSLEKLAAGTALPIWALAGLGLTLLATLIAWFVRQRSLLQHAQHLDDRLSAKNRIEASIELQNDPGPIARAQRDETADYLSHVPKARPSRALLIALALLVAVLTALHPALWLAWTRPWTPAPVIAKATPKPTPTPLPTASIEWKTPEAETKATSVEEVPLAAIAHSTTGLASAVLEISVNGAPKLSTPLTPTELRQPGAHPIETSLYLDQLEVEPYDIVAYYVRARRIDSRKLPDTTSPVQFVQIKPFRDDVQEGPGGDAFGLFPHLKGLKAAQLRLLKENFLLAHTDLDHANPAWKKENDRVGRDQALLVEKTQQVIDKLITDGAPAEIVNLISQAKPQMATAAQKIQASANQPALAPQGKALGLLTEVEKFFIKTASKDGRMKNNPPDVKDPFAREKAFELKQRFKTQAGELELIAEEQRHLADDLAHPNAVPAPTPPTGDKPDLNKIEGTFSERQTQISQRAGALANGQIFVPEVLDHLEKGRTLARESLRGLDAGDPPAAKEPAATAAREFRLAVEAMNRAGDQQAKDQLVKALRALSEAAESARNAPHQSSDSAARKQAEAAAAKANQTARDLAEAARKQQENGSQKAAARLMDFARALSKEDLQKALDHLRETPRDEPLAEKTASRLQELANRAGQQWDRTPLTTEQLARLIDNIQRTRTNLQRLARNPSTNSQAPAAEKNSSPSAGPDKDGNNPSPNRPTPGQAPGQKQAGSQGERENGRQGLAHSDSVSETAFQPPPARGAEDQAITNDTAPLAARARTPEAREHLARELVDNLRELLLEAGNAVPAGSDSSPVREVLQATYSAKAGNASQAAEAIDPPLEGLLTLLREQLRRTQRTYQLSDQDLELAPPAYRAAVADYFEQLSRDYDQTPKETPPEEPATP